MTTIDSSGVASGGVVSGATTSEAIGGIVAIILTILGLAHVAPTFLVAIATIAVGISLVFQGATIAMEYSRLISREAGQVFPIAILGGNSAWSIEVLAGAGGIVLGILALLGVDSADLVAIASIGFGGALVLNGNSTAQVGVVKIAGAGLDASSQRLAADVVSSSAGVQVCAGLAAVVLGILALAGFSPVILILIALLTLGSFVLVNGSALSGMLFTMLRR